MLLLACQTPEDPPTDDDQADDDHADDDAVVGPAILDLKISAVPHNTLSCVVTWTTTIEATSRVEFGQSAADEFYVESSEPVTEHEVFVFGMRPQAQYQLQAVSVSGDGDELRSDEQTFESGEVPFSVIRTSVTLWDADRAYDGWTLTNIAGEGIPTDIFVAMFDMEGYPVWYHALKSTVYCAGAVEATLLDGERVLIGGSLSEETRPVEITLDGEVLWEGPLQTELGLAGAMHHTFQKLNNGNYATLEFDFEGSLHDVIVEIDPELNVVWSWRTFDHFQDFVQTYPRCNALQMDLDEGAAYLHSGAANLLFKIDRDSGAVIWTLGQGGDFAIEGSELEHPWFEASHAHEFLDTGNLLVFDNRMAETPSRVIEYEIDEEAFTARVAWVYPGEGVEDDWETGVGGDADRLPNGNTLIVAPSSRDDGSRSRIFEVTPTGEKVWEMEQYEDGEEMCGSFMAQRIPSLVGTL